MATFTHWIESITASTDCHELPHHQTTIFSSLTSRPLDRKRFRINGLPYLVATSTHWKESISASTDCPIQQPLPHIGQKVFSRQETAIFSSHLPSIGQKVFLHQWTAIAATSVYWIESITGSMSCHIQQPPPSIGQKALPHQWTAILSSHLRLLDRKHYRINGLPYLLATSTHWIESFTASIDCHIQQPHLPNGQKALPHQ